MLFFLKHDRRSEVPPDARDRFVFPCGATTRGTSSTECTNCHSTWWTPDDALIEEVRCPSCGCRIVEITRMGGSWSSLYLFDGVSCRNITEEREREASARAEEEKKEQKREARRAKRQRRRERKMAT